MFNFTKTFFLFLLILIISESTHAKSIIIDSLIPEETLYFNRSDSVFVIQELWSTEYNPVFVQIDGFTCFLKMKIFSNTYYLKDTLSNIPEKGLLINNDYRIFKFPDWKKQKKKSDQVFIIGNIIDSKSPIHCEGIKNNEMMRLISEKLNEKGYRNELDSNGEYSDSFKSAYLKYQKKYMIKLCFWNVYQEFDLDGQYLNDILCSCMKDSLNESK